MQLHNIGKLFRPDRWITLVLCWSLGLSLGIYHGFDLRYIMGAYLRQACHSAITYPVVTTVLPIVFVWLATWRSLSGLIYPLLFLKSFTDGIIFIGLSGAFGAAIWVLAPMLLLSDRIATVVLLLFSANCLDIEQINLHRCFVVCLAITLAAIFFDHYFIAPYLAGLMP